MVSGGEGFRSDKVKRGTMGLVHAVPTKAGLGLDIDEGWDPFR
jgi:hypothetical protein